MAWSWKPLQRLKARRERAMVARAVAAVAQPGTAPAHNVLALSDIHLGHDLRAGANVQELRKRQDLDLQLAGLLDHYRERRRGGLPWRLVLNGDILDFVAISLRPAPGEHVAFTLTQEDLAYGLAAEEAKTVWKLSKIFQRHEPAMDALARFVEAGNTVVVVRGNHDAELAFEAVQRTFRELLADRVHALPGPGRDAFTARIDFANWFYFEPGQLYVEHGHLYDEWCTTDDVLGTKGTGDLELPLSSQVIRYFINVVSSGGQTLDGTDDWGFVDYLRFGLRLGNPLAIASLYASMVWRLLKRPLKASLRFGRRAVAAAGVALVAGVDPDAVHFQRLRAHLADIAGDAGERDTRALMRLLKRPAGGSLFNVLRLFYIDQMMLVALGAAGASAIALVHLPLFHRLLAWAVLGTTFALTSVGLASMRRVDAHPKLLEAAHRVARLFKVRYVVMGHSHRAVTETLEGGARYFNLGAWTGASKTELGQVGMPHLVIADGEARLCRWGAGVLTPQSRPAGSLVTA